MSPWPSKDPNDYVSTGVLVRANRAAPLPLPPNRALLGLDTVSGLVLLGAAFAVAGPIMWIRAAWIFILGSAVARSHIVRRWQWEHQYRTVSWVPASTFAVIVALIGFIIALTLEPTSGSDRENTIFLSLGVAWAGGDALDWALRKLQARRLAAASH